MEQRTGSIKFFSYSHTRLRFLLRRSRITPKSVSTYVLLLVIVEAPAYL